MPSAREWLAQNAKFRVPTYFPDSASTEAAPIQFQNVNFPELRLPTVAFLDPEIVPRYIGVLERWLGDKPLLIDPKDETSQDGAEEIYENLFYPQVEHKDGVPYDEWSKFSSKSDVCNTLGSYKVPLPVWLPSVYNLSEMG